MEQKCGDGEDGLGFDDLEVVQHDDFRTLTLRFVQGDKIKSYDAHFPVVIYRGIFREGEKYAVGDSVTYGGSTWIAEREPDGRPGLPGHDHGWRLAIKRGADGKDGKPGEPGPAGPAGRDMVFNGRN